MADSHRLELGALGTALPPALNEVDRLHAVGEHVVLLFVFGQDVLVHFVPVRIPPEYHAVA